MLKLMYAIEKTNSFRPIPWFVETENFIKFSGSGAGYKKMTSEEFNAFLDLKNIN